jgi:hypothetical protein
MTELERCRLSYNAAGKVKAKAVKSESRLTRSPTEAGREDAHRPP